MDHWIYQKHYQVLHGLTNWHHVLLEISHSLVCFSPNRNVINFLLTLICELDERLQFILTVRIPALSAFSDPSIAAPIPSPTMITFLSHLQVSLEASYISPVMSAVPPSTPTMMSPTRSKPTPTPLRSNLAPRPAPLHPPNTPNPIPSTSTPDLQYARTEGGAVINSYIWGEGREKDAVNAVGPAFSLLWSHTQNLWIALYKLDIAVGQYSTLMIDA